LQAPRSELAEHWLKWNGQKTPKYHGTKLVDPQTKEEVK
jgi:hypothetical protein